MNRATLKFVEYKYRIRVISVSSDYRQHARELKKFEQKHDNSIFFKNLASMIPDKTKQKLRVHKVRCVYMCAKTRQSNNTYSL